MKVKICGITHPEDAKQAAQAGADYVGIIFSKNSKRQVTPALGKQIAQTARDSGATPVGVFVDETLDEIDSICQEADIGIVQLHGHTHLKHIPMLQKSYLVIYAIAVSTDGSLLQKVKLPDNVLLLYDNPGGGKGKVFDWTTFESPNTTPWILAGGLHPKNVSSAICLLQPHIVDVSSGVEIQGSTRKNPDLVEAFIKNAKKGYSMKQHPHKFGGRFLPEILMTPTELLALSWEKLHHCKAFNEELEGLLKHYAGRKTPLTEVKNFARAIDGPRIFLKREDLLHTGAHKINNALGQCLLAQYMGKTRVIAETGAGQHGVATATACAHLGLECVVYMGSKDIERQRPNVEKMKLLGAKIVAVNQGSATLKDAINEALRDWSTNYESSHYCLGSALGPHPYPDIVRTFQSVISRELKEQLHNQIGRLPDLLVACVGGGSNAIGFFHHFIDEKSVGLVGVEAGGIGNLPGQHAARFSGGSPGVLHGCYTYLLQNQEGQILPTHSVSAGLDYPAVGPAHSKLYESGRATYVSVSDEEALQAFHLLTKLEGIIPALESSHALAYVMNIAKDLDKGSIVIINLSGRGEKDLSAIRRKS
jgi:tryptophan synthase beta subunit